MINLIVVSIGLVLLPLIMGWIQPVFKKLLHTTRYVTSISEVFVIDTKSLKFFPPIGAFTYAIPFMDCPIFISDQIWEWGGELTDMVVAHEMGHKINALSQYVGQVIFILSLVSLNFVSGWLVLAGMSFYPYFVRSFELRADVLGAKLIGKEKYIQGLRKFSQDGKRNLLKRWFLPFPTLEEREAAVLRN